MRRLDRAVVKGQAHSGRVFMPGDAGLRAWMLRVVYDTCLNLTADRYDS
jgi:hypothetical protein